MTHKLLIEFVHCEFNAGTNQKKTKININSCILYENSYKVFCRAQKTEEQEEKREKSTHERGKKKTQ